MKINYDLKLEPNFLDIYHFLFDHLVFFNLLCLQITLNFLDEDEGTNVEEEDREKGELETNSVEGDLERKEVPEALMAKEDL